ncbi:hypothetical protein BS47DRAFT_292598 [Hydnum rufescens UP504]|uniref:Uncharacterized protein n=1 Tax=Hydnum rufescens UP504 TaxID=1448309 RepID=A0A9P6E0P8_9AGAM|nr:hypothetical protein BS47DRAFT_292598 [Hydnum rufescens UP504]
MVRDGLFKALLTLFTEHLHDRTLEIALELVASFSFEFSNGVEFREFYDIVVATIQKKDLPIMVQVPAVRSICHVAKNPRSKCIELSLIPLLLERLCLRQADELLMLKLTCALGLVLDNLRLFKEPLLRQLAYEHGQRHVVHAMRPQYRRQFQQSMVISPLLRHQSDNDGQKNVTFVHELTNGANLDILTKLLSREHNMLTRELVALVICNLTANAHIFQVLADSTVAEKLSELVNDPAVTVTAHAKSTIEHTVSALVPYKRRTTRRGHEYETIEQIWSPLSSSWLNYLKPRLSDYGSALFIVRNRTLADNAVEIVFSVVEFMNEVLRDTLRDIAKDVDTLFGLKPSARIQVLFAYLPAFRERVEYLQGEVKVYNETETPSGDEIVQERTEQELETLQSFLQFLEEEWAPWQKKQDELLADGMIEFDLLFAVFKEGMKVRKAGISPEHMF